ncbi:hypothetical protein H6G33_35695 [Calothrix sp. FACHB-1219]|uniref:hypothetical protein n=1 Tax=Calothrix sp. FACHB-1219 TaxID=2692778 RepID=UPI0019A5E5FE|nr:hypothetical protein [Calothrix sp. FACHB-1219]MBD2222277.1 hypothetical protein [Calothrix sp. FACHB-1219]
MKNYNANGHKIKRHKSKEKPYSARTDYEQCLTVLCPTVDEAVGQFRIVQRGRHLLDKLQKKDYKSPQISAMNLSLVIGQRRDEPLSIQLSFVNIND